MKQVPDLGEVFNEVLIEVSKTNEALYFFEAFGNRPVDNSFDLDWVHRDSAMTNNQTKIIYLGLFKLALFGTQIEIVCLKVMEDFVNNLTMFFESAAPNENVVQINGNLALSDEISKD
jgi:hypothetical protein